MSLPQGGLPTLQSITLLPTDPDTQWGNAVMQTGSYVYVYGLVSDPSSGTFYGMKIARVPQGQSIDTSAWNYWNGSGWVGGEQNATTINTGSILTGVAPQAGGTGYVAVSMPGGSSMTRPLHLSYACAPTGPWSPPSAVYTIPQVAEYPNEIAYSPHVSSGTVAERPRRLVQHQQHSGQRASGRSRIPAAIPDAHQLITAFRNRPAKAHCVLDREWAEQFPRRRKACEHARPEGGPLSPRSRFDSRDSVLAAIRRDRPQ